MAGREIRAEWAGAVLALLAVTEELARNGTGQGSLPYGLLLGLLTTAPIALLRLYPAAVAVAVTCADLLAIATSNALNLTTVLAAQLIVLYAAGRRGAQVLTAVLALPFVVLALVPHAGARRAGARRAGSGGGGGGDLAVGPW